MKKLYNADCLEKMKDIPDKSIDMILCDLPYGTTACKSEDRKKNYSPTNDPYEEYRDQDYRKKNKVIAKGFKIG